MFGVRKSTQQEVALEVQDEFIERVQNAAEDFRKAVPSPAALDYSMPSVAALDAVLQEAHSGRLALTPMQTVGAAAYLYEVARRHYGGLYEVCDDDDPVVLVTGEPEFEVCLCAIAKVERCVRNGPAERLPEFFQHYVRAVTDRRSDTIR
ncbi:hypothetical protein CAL18_15355 [Bordetella genomosp. 7]|jgi:hypothetical protein|uniref:Uncharacterized protein n=1 Tax=Bordetella genomosp. 7 TaxID=1416805 RepID=A0A261QY00_9BORD|nr:MULTISPECIES: hypothetical protein [Bordetella]OZI17230.1 hypothetical protein CAL19_15465 [Bordetella genomosp. 7]OZI17499.1 hypothetical protein CAL18_15355 [Bordetella genomosp. 7]